jgi:2'-5' RNA ligase
MARYCIFLIAESPALTLIEDVRRALDPLSAIIPAHVTLVFPFSTDTAERILIEHVTNISSQFTPVETSATHYSFQDDGHIHLRLLDEKRRVEKLHTSLYSGILFSFRDPRFPYQPHITIGRYTPARREAAEQSVSRLILPIPIRLRKVVLEEICENEKSKPLLEVTLGN